jgi:hypothetical protein
MPVCDIAVIPPFAKTSVLPSSLTASHKISDPPAGSDIDMGHFFDSTSRSAIRIISWRIFSKLSRLVSFVALALALVTVAAHAQLGTPQLKAAKPADKGVELSWGAVGGATSYNIYWGTASGITTVNAAGHANQTGVAYTVPSLNNGTTYYFAVTAVDASGESALSNEFSAIPAVQAAAQPKASTATQPTTNVGQSLDTNIQTPTMTYGVFAPSSYPVVSFAAGKPNGKITYDISGVENLIRGACATAINPASGLSAVLAEGQTYTIINVIDLKGDADAQYVASNNWYIYSKDKSFGTGFAGGWQLADFDGATRLYGAKTVLLVSILENDLTPSANDSSSIAYTLTVTKQQPTNVGDAMQLLGLVFPQANAAAVPAAAAVPPSYWACSAVPIAYKTSTIKIDLSYTPGGGNPYTASQSFTSEAKQHWDVSFALPVKKASALQYSSTADTVTASQINKTSLFAVADWYPYPVDLANNKFTFIPDFFAGVAMDSQPLHSLIFGGSVGLKLAQIYAGALLIKQQDLNGLSTGSSATPAQVTSGTTYAYKPSFTVGIKISIKAAASAISGSK